MNIKLKLSTLKHTWIFDVDGTIVKHNGYLIDGADTMLNSVKETFSKIPKDDFIVFITAREKKYLSDLKLFLKNNGIRYDCIIAGVPSGERILVNDIKPNGLITAYSVNKKRDEELDIDFEMEEGL